MVHRCRFFSCCTVQASVLSTPSTCWFDLSRHFLSSPFTANIYLPAIPAVAHAFNRSIEDINLTVTVYMVVQGVCAYEQSLHCGGEADFLDPIAPMFWGTLADRWGRRPMFNACMLILCVICIGIAVMPTDAYWLLMLLRCLQAAGSASTVALGMS